MVTEQDVELLERGMRVYVASPLSTITEFGIQENMRYAESMCNAYQTMYPKSKFVAPHSWFPKFLDDRVPAEREFGMECGRRILSFCDAIMLCGERLSAGMESELRLAVRLGKKVFVDVSLDYWNALSGNRIFEIIKEEQEQPHPSWDAPEHLTEGC